MIPYGIILGGIVSHVANEHKKRELLLSITAVERIYWDLLDEIPIPQEEKIWIYQEILKPKISTMDETDLATILNQNYKNVKRLKKGKPAKYILLKGEDIKKYHEGYCSFIKEELEKNRAKRKRQEYIKLNGEDDQEIIQKFF